jgi:uncharacterized integral membrane protein
MKIKTILYFILTLLFLVILFQNTSIMVIKLLFWQVYASKMIILLCSLTLGFVAGFLLKYNMSRKKIKKIAEEKKIQ